MLSYRNYYPIKPSLDASFNQINNTGIVTTFLSTGYDKAELMQPTDSKINYRDFLPQDGLAGSLIGRVWLMCVRWMCH
jgi:hypothetical protein